MATLVHDVQSTVVESAGDRAAQFTQFIPQSFVDDLKERRKQSDAAPIGELLHAATIPTFVVERWMREGFTYLFARSDRPADHRSFGA
jgi:hypothetical protein